MLIHEKNVCDPYTSICTDAGGFAPLGNFPCFFVICYFFFQNQLFRVVLSGIPSECQTIWVQISGLDKDLDQWVFHPLLLI